MMPEPPEPEPTLAPDAAWFLLAYEEIGMPYSGGGMGGIVVAPTYSARQEYLDRNWPAHLGREAPESIWSDLDAYHLARLSEQIEAATDKVPNG